MNTMLADSLDWIAGKLESTLASGKDQTAAVIIVLKELMELHGNVIFGGDGYSTDWHKAAVEERGLKNIPTTADALPAFKEDSIVKLFENTGVLTAGELASRFEVYSEQYILSIEVEAKLAVDMATTKIYPAAISHISKLTETAAGLAALKLSLDNSGVDAAAKEANAMMGAVNELSAAIDKEDFSSTEEHMQFCAGTICPLMLKVREHADALEGLVADELWPLPKYQEMLFIK